MTIEQLQELKELRENPSTEILKEYASLFSLYTQEKLDVADVCKLRDQQLDLFTRIVVLDLVKRAPGELGFIVSCKTYEDYIKTFTDVGGSKEETPYTEEEFKKLKDYFGDEE